MINKEEVTGVILAAGKSGRMGKWKPLMQYQGKSFLQSILEKLLPVCNSVIIVTGAHHERLAAFGKVTDVMLAHNEKFEHGMLSSLQTGLSEVKTEFTLYHFIDQPHLPHDFYPDFLQFASRDANWIQPQYLNRAGHPMLIRKDVIPYILNAKPDMMLREIRSHKGIIRGTVDLPYPEILQDIDTPEDYQKYLNSSAIEPSPVP